MKLLLYTQLLLWAAGQPDRPSVEAREAIENGHNELIFSSASLWGGRDKKHARAA
jgi:PIN domain nuclease of toxin-antitoxin system